MSASRLEVDRGKIVRVFRFGGSRELPGAWGILEPNGDRTSDVTIFGGCDPIYFGHWFLDLYDQGSYRPMSDDEVPDEVWAMLAKWRLTQC